MVKMLFNVLLWYLLIVGGMDRWIIFNGEFVKWNWGWGFDRYIKFYLYGEFVGWI